MNVFRWVFLVACLACIVNVSWNGRWEGRLKLAGHTWIVDLGRSPVWDPPTEPPYAKFQEVFTLSKGFPVDGTQGTTINRALMLDWMAFDLLLYLWLITLAGGLGYLFVRKKRRSLILHLGLSVGIGLTASAVVCIGLWLLLGGWGPPVPEFFGGLGLVLGFVVGLASFNRRAEQVNAADRGNLWRL
jgi:hypothetical protein